MRRLLRFHLASLLISSLTAAVLLGVNLIPQHANQRRATFPQIIRLDNDWSTVDVYEHGNVLVWVSQGWPFCAREEDAVTRQISPNAKPEPWVWSYYAPLQWNYAVANGAIALVASVAVLAGVEWLLRRRTSSRGAN